jgi:Omp85 superfamily domain
MRVGQAAGSRVCNRGLSHVGDLIVDGRTVAVWCAMIGLVCSRSQAQQAPGAPPPPDSAQQAAMGDGRCHGELVSAIEIITLGPSYGQAGGTLQFLQNAAEHVHPETKEAVVRGYLQLRVGRHCSEVRRAESERLLRGRPFLQSARVTASPDTGGTVRITVETIDRFPFVFDLRTQGVVPQALTLGDANAAGEGVRATLSGELGHAYRDGIGAGVTDYAFLHEPVVATLQGIRAPRGQFLDAGITHPYLTDLQRASWEADIQDTREDVPFQRPANDGLVLPVRETRINVGGLLRQRALGEIGLVGLVFSSVRIQPASEGVVVTDSGYAPDTGHALAGRYSTVTAGRPSVLAGVRLIRYQRVQGFNTLSAIEDIPKGLQIGGMAGRGLSAFGSNDLLLSGSMYAGAATPHQFIGLQIESEARDDYERRLWDDHVWSARLAFYGKVSRAHTVILSDEFSSVGDAELPFQLTLGNREGGLRGYAGNTLAGSARNVIRAEHRWLFGTVFNRADLGAAAFADGGSLWGGGVPYADQALFRASFGVSLLAAYPQGSKHLLRLDLAVPATHEGNHRVEIRFSTADLTRRFWREPYDVARARAGPTPSKLFVWPSQ